MIQGVGASLKALSADQQRMDALANDVANVDTEGFEASGRSGTQCALVDTRTSYSAAIKALHVQDEVWQSLLELRQ